MELKSTIKILLLLSIVSVTMALHQRTPEALADQVLQLDGYYDFSKDFEMYSGFLKIQQQPQISIHYMFITSMRDSPKDDLTLWLNGGPGCSSLLGFAQQVGPNNLLSGSTKFTAVKNPYSWNQISNMVFFESPAGVGFSINDDRNYVYNDTRTAQDALKTLQQFYKRFPEFKRNKFWIAGQSYCGMYIPYLANEVLTQDPSINLQGILIGNGAMWLNMNWRGMMGDKFWTSHYYYGPEISQLINRCKYDGNDDKNPSCARGMSLAARAVDKVNPYFTTGVCYPDEDGSTLPGQMQNRGKFYRTPFHAHNNSRLGDVQGGSGSPCTDDIGISKYFNLPNVRAQLKITRKDEWTPCSDIEYHMSNASLHFFEGFKQKGLKILLYSGNVDAVVPYTETQDYIRQIGWKVTQEKKPLVNVRGSLMGWQVQYDGLTYVIINGAGHMVPSDKPHAAYEMYKNFIEQKKQTLSTENLIEMN